ncbi:MULTISPECIES: DUF2291 family protein [Tenebrionibacter/Tenebrionicola group]|jgi:predicted lipoprotein|uniref:DUF2291 domain-containing protein n=2 Tax=Tenebrionibacter/Tenebrionicola group TaxID=2969848 RepID=A0A8K0V6X0_9ENTR|nr:MULTISPECIES: DUF2291 domain-containing protein [Tenebrionibacter/Tenebrionicola group]MBK4715317.1 DUF2291 domain-containing protein [Tenebrionibacter intestinalis]MBV5096063.1 DUF2291 domain-containing protein [Tenebrionicola larvae]
MSRQLWLALMLLAPVLGGCRIVSRQELADLKNPPNPHMANIDQTWQQKIVPQIADDARPAGELMRALSAADDFDSACIQYGWRAQPENPCVFAVRVSGTVEKVDTASRSGKVFIKDSRGETAVVQLGPTLRGTALRDGYKGVSYQDFNDQALFGDFSRAINERAGAMMKTFNPQPGETVTIDGVFSVWDIPARLPEITPAKAVRAQGGV